jgi:hypothetical protein
MSESKNKKYGFKIYGYKLRKNKKQYALFTQITNNIFNDKLYKKRLIKEDIEFMKLTNKLFNKSYLIVKGKEDFKALHTHMKLLNIEPFNSISPVKLAAYSEADEVKTSRFFGQKLIDPVINRKYNKRTGNFNGY